jgi:phenylalanine-4-hydroxylase
MCAAEDVRTLIELEPDHPGFQDGEYRRRRNEIAAIALRYRTGKPVPDAPYTDEEHAVWRDIRALLDPLHERFACRELVELARLLPMPTHRIPQLAALNPPLEGASGFRMEPVMGLVSARSFLRHLGRRVFLSTQYIRHHSRPLYTPEPDIVHELIGHAASLAHPAVAAVNAAMGVAAEVATEGEMRRLEHVYWYTLEFGVVEERGALRAFGAGLLSSAGEIAQMGDGPELRSWDLDRIAASPYDPTKMQPHLWVAPSFRRMLDDIEQWVAEGRWRGERWKGVREGAVPVR